MVQFRINGEAAALQSLDHVKLPKRACTIEQDHMQTRNQRAQLLVRAGLRQGNLTNVVIEIDIVVVDPHGMIELNRRQNQLAMEKRQQV